MPKSTAGKGSAQGHNLNNSPYLQKSYINSDTSSEVVVVIYFLDIVILNVVITEKGSS